ncbi:MAG: DnaA regulatory inactivator Hda [Acidiferrobacteraceae bacterium]|nr:DnaA regulatory inactivator Hda [Acidiferrobacteraceae bacterium]
MIMQLHLPIRLNDVMSLDNFLPGDNKEVISALNNWIENRTSGRVLFLFGIGGSGRSHLLQAVCRSISGSGGLSVYVPADQSDITSDLISQLDPSATVCIDDFDCIAGDIGWEESILEVYERLVSGSGRLLISALRPPLALSMVLPDLESRLAAAHIYRIHALNEEDFPQAMKLRARKRGLELSDDVIDYILRRAPRDSRYIFSLLDRADEAAFASKRRLTIPLLRDLERE